MTDQMEGLRAGLERYEQIGQVEGQALALTLRTGLLCERVAQLSMDNDQLKCALRNLKDSFRVGSERLSSRNAYLEGVGQEHADLQARVKSSLQVIAESLLDEMGRLDCVWGTDVDSDVDGARAQVRARIEAYAESLIDEVVRIDMFLESGHRYRVGESASGSCPEKSSSDGLAQNQHNQVQLQVQVQEEVEELEIAVPTPHTTKPADILAMQELVEAALAEAGESHRQCAELTARVHSLEGVKGQVVRLQSALKETRLQLFESQAKIRDMSDHWRRERELLIKENSAIADRARVHSSKAEKRTEHVVQQLNACKKQLEIAMRENAAGRTQVAAASVIGERNANLQRKLDLEAQEAMRKQLADAQKAAVAEKEALQKQISSLQASGSDAAAQISAQLADAQKAAAAEKEAMRKQVADAQKQLESLQASSSDKDKALSAEREAMRKQLADAQKAAVAEKEALQKQVADAQMQLDASKASGSAVAEQLCRVESELVSARASLSSVEAQLKFYVDKEQHDCESLEKLESELALKIGELRGMQSEVKLTCISEVSAQSTSLASSATSHLGDEEQALLQGIFSTREALKLQLKQLEEDGSHAKTSPHQNLLLMSLQEELKNKDSSLIKAQNNAMAMEAEIVALNRAAEATAASQIDSENETAQFRIRISYLETELLKKTADLVAFVELQTTHKRLQSKHEALEYEREAYRAEMIRIFEAEQKERERNSGPTTVASPAKSAEIVTSFVSANQELQSLNRELLKKVACYETAEHDARDAEERWARCLDDERAHSKHLMACLEAAQLATAANDEEFAAQRERLEQLERELRGRR